MVIDRVDGHASSILGFDRLSNYLDTYTVVWIEPNLLFDLKLELMRIFGKLND